MGVRGWLRKQPGSNAWTQRNVRVPDVLGSYFGLLVRRGWAVLGGGVCVLIQVAAHVLLFFPWWGWVLVGVIVAQAWVGVELLREPHVVAVHRQEQDGLPCAVVAKMERKRLVLGVDCKHFTPPGGFAGPVICRVSAHTRHPGDPERWETLAGSNLIVRFPIEFPGDHRLRHDEPYHVDFVVAPGEPDRPFRWHGGLAAADVRVTRP